MNHRDPNQMKFLVLGNWVSCRPEGVKTPRSLPWLQGSEGRKLNATPAPRGAQANFMGMDPPAGHASQCRPRQ